MAASQTRAVRSRLPVTTLAPSGLKVTAVTSRSWPTSQVRTSPEPASRTAPLPSQLPVTMRVPSALTTALLTSRSCPSSSRTIRPVAMSQTRALSSPLAVTRRVASGLNATLVTAWTWPGSSSDDWPEPVASQYRAVASWLVVTTFAPSLLNLAKFTPRVCPRKLVTILPVSTSCTTAVPSRLPVSNPAAVGAERGAVHRVGVRSQLGQHPAGVGLPHPRRPVEARRDDPVAFRVELGAPDVVAVARQGGKERVRGQVPHACGPVPAGGGRQAAVGTDRQRPDAFGVAAEDG